MVLYVIRLYSCACMCSVSLHFREKHCYNKLKGIIQWLLKNLFCYSCLEQYLVWSWVISLRSLPTWITFRYYEDMRCCCVQIGNSCIAPVKLCTERQLATKQLSQGICFWISWGFSQPTGLTPKSSPVLQCMDCSLLFWCCLPTRWDGSLPSFRLLIRPIKQ